MFSKYDLTVAKLTFNLPQRGVLVNEVWFTPTIETVVTDDTFISEDPRILNQRGVNKVPYVLGCNQADGSLLSGRM